MAYGTLRFNATSTRVLQKSLSWTESTEFLVLIPISLQAILILSSYVHQTFLSSYYGKWCWFNCVGKNFRPVYKAIKSRLMEAADSKATDFMSVIVLYWRGGHCCPMHCDLFRSIVFPWIWVLGCEYAN